MASALAVVPQIEVLEGRIYLRMLTLFAGSDISEGQRYVELKIEVVNGDSPVILRGKMSEAIKGYARDYNWTLSDITVPEFQKGI